MSPDELNAIEAEFVASWDWMENYYTEYALKQMGWNDVSINWLKPMHPFLLELRQKGYDRKFRAGQQMMSLVLSRSQKHALRSDQACFVLDPLPEHIAAVSYYEFPDVRIQFTIAEIKLSPEIEKLLQRLLAHPID